MQFPLQLRFKLIALAPQITVSDASGSTLLYVQQKLFKLREKIHVYTDSSRQTEVAQIQADRILDFSAAYAFTTADGRPFGSVRRRGMRSLWKAHYEISTSAGQTFAVEEENALTKVADSLIGGIPIIGAFTGFLFHPAYKVCRGGDVVMRLVKRPAFFEGKFEIELHASDLTEDEQLQVTLALLMVTLLERQRG